MDDSIYERIGVRSFINCCGTRTIHGGTLMWPGVKEAMMAAADGFVNMDELMEGVGRRLGELTGAEWGMVASGGAAALCHATAACVAGADPEVMLRLPDTRGLKDRVVMLKGGRFTYDHAIRTVGVEIVEVGDEGELVRALDERVVMVALLGTHDPEASVRLEAVVSHTGQRGIPVLVDAASEHLKRPNPYLSRGATMVSYSGGKYLRGPQASGLLLGEEKWVRMAWLNAAPHHAIGRAMKVGKEEVMGVLAAVEYWADGRDHAGERAQWRTDLQVISECVTALDGVETEILEPADLENGVPKMEIRWGAYAGEISGLALREQLLEGTPRIVLDDRWATDASVLIAPFSLQPGEAAIVGERIREALEQAPERREKANESPVPVAGTWTVEIGFVMGTSTHQVTLEQAGETLRGTHQTRFHSNPLIGCVRGDQVDFSSLHPYEGTHLAYRFVGCVDGDEMEGTVELGSEGQSAPGPLNRREYGKGQWRAKRVG
ncbi:MAG: hypothetical protein O7G87_23880 [bacterium]|nr:hypothetical protein [bacterium]